MNEQELEKLEALRAAATSGEVHVEGCVPAPKLPPGYCELVVCGDGPLIARVVWGAGGQADANYAAAAWNAVPRLVAAIRAMLDENEALRKEVQSERALRDKFVALVAQNGQREVEAANWDLQQTEAEIVRLQEHYTKSELRVCDLMAENEALRAKLEELEQKMQAWIPDVEEVAFQDCTNPECPVGCPDSHCLGEDL